MYIHLRCPFCGMMAYLTQLTKKFPVYAYKVTPMGNKKIIREKQTPKNLELIWIKRGEEVIEWLKQNQQEESPQRNYLVSAMQEYVLIPKLEESVLTCGNQNVLLDYSKQ